ncbi:hypothetical protein LOAG_07743 [Loa loa]|uniref:Kinesin motor domain-containing protein n=1 Tax=Loa loa TaxID=7209 RepID=A0A1I7V7E7_LOALO|nr:hypothetical protein LOAG_07743 [Loa loa]EFO20751.1 hypothetical protein LOAG_07743 [Loa loa]
MQTHIHRESDEEQGQDEGEKNESSGLAVLGKDVGEVVTSWLYRPVMSFVETLSLPEYEVTLQLYESRGRRRSACHVLLCGMLSLFGTDEGRNVIVSGINGTKGDI